VINGVKVLKVNYIIPIMKKKNS